jgi:hypothetical protein
MLRRVDERLCRIAAAAAPCYWLLLLQLLLYAHTVRARAQQQRLNQQVAVRTITTSNKEGIAYAADYTLPETL